MLAEALGEAAYRERVKIYATDVDEDALTAARLAVYDAKQLESVPEALRAKYFERANEKLAFRKGLRRAVIFGRNNLVSDAPISRLDLLVCRNTLMYFTAETQGRLAALANGDAVELSPPADDSAGRDAALEIAPYAQLIVSRGGDLTFANLAARGLFRITPGDLGRRFAELEISRTPTNLLPALEQSVRDRRRVDLGETRYEAHDGEEHRLEITVSPLVPAGSPPRGACVTFQDVSRYVTLQSELEVSRRDLELAYEELQSTIDELETTNEELQSANEELQTTNEELQSTNEELETMNEELQATNEELGTINDELRDRTAELNQVNDSLEVILSSLGVGVAVVDRQQRVQVWNHRAEDLWGLRQDEAVDHHLLSLDIGLPVERLAGQLRSVLGGATEREEFVLEAINRRGRTIECTTTIVPLAPSRDSDGSAVRGAIVLMEDARTDGEE